MFLYKQMNKEKMNKRTNNAPKSFCKYICFLKGVQGEDWTSREGGIGGEEGH